MVLSVPRTAQCAQRPAGPLVIAHQKRSSRQLCHRCSLTQSRPTLFDPMGCSTPGRPVLHHLPELAQSSAQFKQARSTPLPPQQHPYLKTPGITRHLRFRECHIHRDTLLARDSAEACQLEEASHRSAPQGLSREPPQSLTFNTCRHQGGDQERGTQRSGKLAGQACRQLFSEKFSMNLNTCMFPYLENIKAIKTSVPCD